MPDAVMYQGTDTPKQVQLEVASTMTTNQKTLMNIPFSQKPESSAVGRRTEDGDSCLQPHVGRIGGHTIKVP